MPGPNLPPRRSAGVLQSITLNCTVPLEIAQRVHATAVARQTTRSVVIRGLLRQWYAAELRRDQAEARRAARRGDAA